MMTAQTFKNNIPWYPLIWIGAMAVAPFLIYAFVDGVTVLSSIAISASFLSIVFQYLEMKLKAVSIQDGVLHIKNPFRSSSSIPLSELKYAKLKVNHKLKRLIFGTGKQSLELYGKWGFEILDVENPELLLRMLKEESNHFN